MKIFKDRFLILSLLLGLIIRLLLTPVTGFKFDVDTWFAWAQRLNEVGFTNFYFDKVWTGYPPGFLYILSSLGFIKNLFNISDPNFYLVLKLPSIFAELILGLVIYQIIPDKLKLWKKLALIIVMLNPAFIFNSAVFGQFDGLFSLIVFLVVFYLQKNKLILSSVLLGLAFLFKPQAILLFPLLLFFILKNFSMKAFVELFLPATFTIILGFLPFFPTSPINGPINLISTLLGFYPYNSIFAYNLWGILGFWVKDNNIFMNISYQNWGYILFSIFWISVFFIHQKKKLSLYSIATLAGLSFFFILTRMHERYLYPGLVFLMFFSVTKKSVFLTILTIALSLIHFLNLYYVYIYYNQFYLKIPQIIYNVVLYNFADKNIPVISLFSTLIFFLISISILKLDYEYKKI